MLVCGDHAKNDMAVEWKEEFENNGFNVECDLTGLGEIKEIQDMYAEHLKNVLGTVIKEPVDKMSTLKITSYDVIFEVLL